jgi:hypothetical protein
MPRRKQESGMSSTTKWVLAVVLGLPLLCCGGGLLMLLNLWMQAPYAEAMARVENHPGVIKVLGAPITGSRLFWGSLTVDKDDNAQADMQISLSGSKQDGTLRVRAMRSNGVWGFNVLHVVADDRQVVFVVGGGRRY